MNELSNYKIPPPFFGPIAAAQASKSFRDDYFQQFDNEMMNYIVEPPELPQKRSEPTKDATIAVEEIKEAERKHEKPQPVNFGMFKREEQLLAQDSKSKILTAIAETTDEKTKREMEEIRKYYEDNSVSSSQKVGDKLVKRTGLFYNAYQQ